MIDQMHPCIPGVKLHPERPASGEWVKFKADLPPHAHVCPEGYCVGIYIRAGFDSAGDWVPEHIAPCDGDGLNLLPFPHYVKGTMNDVKPELRPLFEPHPQQPGIVRLKVRMDPIRLDPSQVTNLHCLEDWEHLPKTRADITRKEHPDMQTAAWHRRDVANKLKAKRDAQVAEAMAEAARKASAKESGEPSPN